MKNGPYYGSNTGGDGGDGGAGGGGGVVGVSAIEIDYDNMGDYTHSPYFSGDDEEESSTENTRHETGYNASGENDRGYLMHTCTFCCNYISKCSDYDENRERLRE